MKRVEKCTSTPHFELLHRQRVSNGRPVATIRQPQLSYLCSSMRLTTGFLIHSFENSSHNELSPPMPAQGCNDGLRRARSSDRGEQVWIDTYDHTTCPCYSSVELLMWSHIACLARDISKSLPTLTHESDLFHLPLRVLIGQ